MASEELPERPRLRRGCRVFAAEEGLIVRSARAAFRIEPVHRDAMRRVLARLDGTHDFAALLGDERPADAFYVLRILDALAQHGFLAEGPRRVVPPPDTSPARLDGVTLILSDEDPLPAALGPALAALGAVLVREHAQDAIRLVCPDGPDLERLAAINRSALATGSAWLPVFPFGDAIVVGPRIQPRRSPCFRCLELRWLAISPSIALERAYFRYVRTGGWRDESPVDPDEVPTIAAQLATSIAPPLAHSQPDARLSLIWRDSGAVTPATLVRHPRCDACGEPGDATATDPDGAPGWFEPPLPLAELRQRTAALADRFFGFAALLTPRDRAVRPELPRVVVARFAMPEPEEVDGTQDNWCHGAAARQEDAETLALVEAVERYSGLSPAPAGILASYASLAGRALLPTELPLFSPTQYAQPGFAFSPFDPDRVVRWSAGYNLTRKRPILVPSTAAWYGQDDHLLGETSSGVAAHSSRGSALLNGALELVERDAFMIHWLYRLSPPLLDLDQLDDPASLRLVHHLEERGYAVRVADLRTDLEIPMYLALGVREDRQRPALIVGAGASLDPATALARALGELHAAVLNPTPLWTLKPAIAVHEVHRLEDHSHAYEHPDWLPHAAFLWASPRRVPLRGRAPGSDDVSSALGTLTAQLAHHGHDLIGVDITAPELAAQPIRVVRAIVPGLQPLGFARRVRLGGRRLHEAPVRMGYREIPLREDQLNPIPHCFP